MDKDRAAGAMKTVLENVKEGVGKIVGDRKTIVEGQAEQKIGKARMPAGAYIEKSSSAAGFRTGDRALRSDRSRRARGMNANLQTGASHDQTYARSADCEPQQQGSGRSA
jgi:uncharacterized protein YjbJ (UPF0337 family)